MPGIGEPGPGTRPMQASPGDLPRGAGWAFEFVWTGLRCLAQVRDGELRLVDADGHDVTAGFPELGVPGTPGLVLDGVVVASSTSSPYAVSYLFSTVGTFSLVARATASDSTTTDSAPATINVVTPIGNPPTVGIATPASGASPS